MQYWLGVMWRRHGFPGVQCGVSAQRLRQRINRLYPYKKNILGISKKKKLRFVLHVLQFIVICCVYSVSKNNIVYVAWIFSMIAILCPKLVKS